MNGPGTRLTHHIRHLAFGLSLLHGASAAAQVINDPFEQAATETYTGGFGTFNWVSAAGFGFADHAGAMAFLSAYTGPPLSGIGMTKPLGGSMGSTTYRVSFFTAKYGAQAGVPFADFTALYIGSANGISVWDTVPTPTVDGLWLKWSGTFTPDIADIGQPFVFGFSMTLNSGVSFAMDGPVEVKDLATGVQDPVWPQDLLHLFPDPATDHLSLAIEPRGELLIHDLRGMLVRRQQATIVIDIADLPSGIYAITHLVNDRQRRAVFVKE